jgi:hypothetical protein
LGAESQEELSRFSQRGFRLLQPREIGCGKTQSAVILSEAKNLSLFLFLNLNRREILRFAQNDKTRHFFRSLERVGVARDVLWRRRDAGATNSRNFLPPWKETHDGKESWSETIPEKRCRAGRHDSGRIAASGRRSPRGRNF